MQEAGGRLRELIPSVGCSQIREKPSSIGQSIDLARLEGADYFSKTVGFVPGYDSIDQTISACGLPLAV